MFVFENYEKRYLQKNIKKIRGAKTIDFFLRDKLFTKLNF